MREQVEGRDGKKKKKKKIRDGSVRAIYYALYPFSPRLQSLSRSFHSRRLQTRSSADSSWTNQQRRDNIAVLSLKKKFVFLKKIAFFLVLKNGSERLAS